MKWNLTLFVATALLITPAVLRAGAFFTQDSEMKDDASLAGEFSLSKSNGTEISVTVDDPGVSPSPTIVLGSTEAGIGKYGGITKKLPADLKKCTASFEFRADSRIGGDIDLWIGFRNIDGASRPLTYIRCRCGENPPGGIPGFTIYDGTRFQATDLTRVDPDVWYEVTVSIDFEKHSWGYSIRPAGESQPAAEAQSLPLLESDASAAQYFSVAAVESGGRIAIAHMSLKDE